MAVGSDPRICLSFLYKNDPFYSFCLSDLLSAPQQVRNKFLKEQNDLMVTLGKLEHQKLSRLRQLDEEKKHFRLLMIKKLAPKVTISSGSFSITEQDFQTPLSSVQVSSLALSKSSWKSLDTKLYTRPDATFFSTVRNEHSATYTPEFCKAPGSYFRNTEPVNTYKHLPSKKHLARSEIYLPLFDHTMPSVHLCETSKRN